MNKKNIIGIALIASTAVFVGLACSEVGDCVARFVGKAVWYLPYATLVGGVGMLRSADRKEVV